MGRRGFFPLCRDEAYDSGSRHATDQAGLEGGGEEACIREWPSLSQCPLVAEPTAEDRSPRLGRSHGVCVLPSASVPWLSASGISDKLVAVGSVPGGATHL